jgi:hypothetical protein
LPPSLLHDPARDRPGWRRRKILPCLLFFRMSRPDRNPFSKTNGRD